MRDGAIKVKRLWPISPLEKRGFSVLSDRDRKTLRKSDQGKRSAFEKQKTLKRERSGWRCILGDAVASAVRPTETVFVLCIHARGIVAVDAATPSPLLSPADLSSPPPSKDKPWTFALCEVRVRRFDALTLRSSSTMDCHLAIACASNLRDYPQLQPWRIERLYFGCPFFQGYFNKN